MFSGVISLVIAKEVATAQLDTRIIADAHYTSGASYEITYDISSRGEITGNIDEFRTKVAEIYADERGWSRAGVTFKEVESGGQMHVILATRDEVKKASPSVCSDELSCRVGQNVLINDARWMGGSDAYNALSVSLDNYRRMVVNHETGHFLGHDHLEQCETNGGLGAVMIRRAQDLGACSPTSWPLPSELWVRR